MSIALRWILALVLTLPVIGLSALLVGSLAGSLQYRFVWLCHRLFPSLEARVPIGAPLLQYVPTVILTVACLSLGIALLCAGAHVYASICLLAFSSLLAVLIPAFTLFCDSIARLQEPYRNLQFLIWLVSGGYFCYTVLGLL